MMRPRNWMTEHIHEPSHITQNIAVDRSGCSPCKIVWVSYSVDELCGATHAIHMDIFPVLGPGRGPAERPPGALPVSVQGTGPGRGPAERPPEDLDVDPRSVPQESF